jgi:hypothetical protein
MTKAQDDGPASSVKMAAHLDLDRAYLTKLVSQGVLAQRPDGKFDLDDNRRHYIRFLREERKRSPKSEADSAFTQAKAELLQIRVAERKKELMMASECYGLLDEVHGLFMTALSALPAKIGGRDLAMRRKVEAAIYDMRVELANEAAKRANERGEPDEPPLSEQGPEARPA